MAAMKLSFLTFQHQTAVISRASSRSPCLLYKRCQTSWIHANFRYFRCFDFVRTRWDYWGKPTEEDPVIKLQVKRISTGRSLTIRLGFPYRVILPSWTSRLALTKLRGAWLLKYQASLINKLVQPALYFKRNFCKFQ